MSRLRTFCSRLLELLLRRNRENRLSDEIQAHLDLLVDEHLARGLTEDEAWLAARRSFGGVDQVKEAYRDQRGLPWIDTFAQDVRFAFRLMKKSPAFTLTAAGSLALSIGSLTLAFSAVNALVLKPLPIADPESVYFVQSTAPGWSFPDYLELRDRTDTVKALAGYRITMMNAGLQPESTILWGYLVTGNYFDTLGVTPAAGRFFTQEEDRRPGASPLAVLSYDTWQARFGGRHDVIGQSMPINGLPYTIIGIAPRGFHGTEVFYRPEVWVPMMMQAQIEARSTWLTQRETSNTMVVARLKPGVSRAQGEANLASMVTQLNREFPNRNRPLTVRLTRPGLLGDVFGGPARMFVWGLFALGALLMLAGCSNLAGLLLARGADRAREIAVRTALGAGRGRIARQLFTESVLLAVGGGMGGAALAWAGSTVASRQRLPVDLPVQIDFTADHVILAFAFGVAVLVGLVVGIAPARLASRVDLTTSLKSAPGFRFGGRRIQTRDVLVVVQVALCVVLLHACFLAVRGLQRASTASLGWNPSGIALAATELGLAGYSEAEIQVFERRLLEEGWRLPGVQSVAAAYSLPLHIDLSRTTVFAQPAREPDTGESAAIYQVSPGFFRTLEIPLRNGRDFIQFDTVSSPQVAVINRALAERLFGDVDAVGRQLRQGRGGKPVEIVGIVEDGKYAALAETRSGAIFRPLSQSYSRSMMVIARAQPGVTLRTEDLRQVLHRLDPNLPIRLVATGDQIAAFPLLPYRTAVAALGLLGLICSGLLLSGLHALLAYVVAKRQREIGIRIALGADRASVLRVVFARVAVILAMGTAAGAVLSAGTGPLVSSLVLGVSPREPLLLAAIVVGLAVIAFASSVGPVRKSLRVEPLAALREE